jgi:hypothetical protein
MGRAASWHGLNWILTKNLCLTLVEVSRKEANPHYYYCRRCDSRFRSNPRVSVSKKRRVGHFKLLERKGQYFNVRRMDLALYPIATFGLCSRDRRWCPRQANHLCPSRIVMLALNFQERQVGPAGLGGPGPPHPPPG